MSYNTKKVSNLLCLKKFAQRIQSRFSALESSLASNVTASTDKNADYAAELVDARTDTNGNTHKSAGSNIRYWQGSLTDANDYMQAQINELSEAYIEILTQIGQMESRLRELES